MPEGPSLTVAMWVAAASPLLLLVGSMLGLKWGGARAGPLGCGGALLIGFLVFKADLTVLGVAMYKGLFLSLYVLYIIWPALLLYHIVDASGAIHSIGIAIARLTRDHIMQLLILGFAFSSFLQGVAGFGVPVAVVAPLLVGLGFPPVQATAVPLIGHAWAVTMGDLASSFQALVVVTELPERPMGLWVALFLGIACVVTGFCIAHLHAGLRPIRRSFGAILAIGLSMGLTQFLLAYWEHWILASFAAGMAGLGCSILIARLAAPGHQRPFWGLLPIWPSQRQGPLDHGLEVVGIDPQTLGPPPMSFHVAFGAYYVLIGVVLAATLIPGVHDLLRVPHVIVPFPATGTGLGWQVAASEYRIIPFAHPGGLLLYTAIAACGVYGLAGHWTPATLRTVWWRTWGAAVPTTIGVISMVVMALVMVYAGMTTILAHGVTSLAGWIYPLLSPAIGLLGCVVTGSNTNANVLFGAFQRDSALFLGLNPMVVAALQSTGASLGSMAAPAKVLVACATVGLAGREGEVIGLTLRYCLPLVSAMGILGWIILRLS
ncbi:MAG: L-lactate permease [Nitrospinae bacterium]|nr:L-lactate permease [Nitrospinota bacterium]